MKMEAIFSIHGMQYKFKILRLLIDTDGTKGKKKKNAEKD